MEDIGALASKVQRIEEMIDRLGAKVEDMTTPMAVVSDAVAGCATVDSVTVAPHDFLPANTEAWEVVFRFVPQGALWRHLVIARDGQDAIIAAQAIEQALYTRNEASGPFDFQVVGVARAADRW